MLDIPDFTNRHVLYDIVMGWTYAHFGMPEKIALWFKNNLEHGEQDMHYQNYETMVKAKALFAEKRYADVLKFIEDIGSGKGLASSYFGILEISALEAAARLRLGDEMGALIAMQKAYEMSAANVIDTPFVELGVDMRDLADAAKSLHGVPRLWMEKMRSKASVYAKKMGAVAECCRGGQAKRPILTLLELSILADISRGFSRAEIAESASCSIAAIKKSIKTIYRKLGAINRADAIRIASSFGLLE